MSRVYLDSIRNPQPYPVTSDTSNPPSRARTPVVDLTRPRQYSRPPSSLQHSSRPTTPSAVLELTNPKPYPRQSGSDVVKPTPVKAQPKTYTQNGDDKQRNKRYTKTKNTPRSSQGNTPVQSDSELKTTPKQSRAGSVSSIDLTLRMADIDPIKSEPTLEVRYESTPTHKTTSLDGPDAGKPTYTEIEENADHKSAVDTLAVKPKLSKREKIEKQLKAGRMKGKEDKERGKDEEEKEEEEDERPWYKRHERKLWILCLVFFLVVIFMALALGLSLGGVALYRDGEFARTYGEECRFGCRNRDRYTNRDHSPLIILAVDGLPTDLRNTSRDFAINIKRLSQCGTYSYDVISSFASTSYPNLWTLLTGRYPQSHGVRSDYMKDGLRVFEPRVSQNNLRDPEWYKATPLWATAREQGVITASHSWLGGDMNTMENDEGQTINKRPNYYQSFNRLLTPRDKMDTVKRWIDQDDVAKIPQFITVFFNELAEDIRLYEHYSERANETMKEIDDAIGSLLDYLMWNQDLACFNIIVVSPSGLTPTMCGGGNENVEFLSSHVTSVIGLDTTPDYLNTFASISVSSSADENYNTNEEFTEFFRCKFSDKGSVFMRHELPTRFHYSYEHVPNDVYVLMKNGFSFARESTDYSQLFCQHASNGYDTLAYGMEGFFVGFGHDFKVNHRVRDFNNIDIYNMMTKILGLTPELHNGTEGGLNSLLRNAGTFPVPSMAFASEGTCPYVASVSVDNYMNELGCTCSTTVPVTERINIALSTTESTVQQHVPFGPPEILESASPGSGSVCKLYHTSYVTAYDRSLVISKYVSVTLASDFFPGLQPSGCVLVDTRLAMDENPRCLTYTSGDVALNIKQSYLLQPTASVGKPDESIVSSNIVPQYSLFESEIWSQLVSKYSTWTSISANINIVQGPVYDLDHNGVVDSPSTMAKAMTWAGPTVVPSHYFVVASRCANRTEVRSCLPSDVEIMAFILPHNNLGRPCQTSMDEYLMAHRASLQGVERITGLYFFPTWSRSDNSNYRQDIALQKAGTASMLWT
ncbi:venom phosphodiesterase 2-like [Diadema setosum]|uniref:venom phosphodiesterase 2-like n=1 Tax=Diadema setosum TaxID=31175 RepID=UPI003B3AACCD